MREDNLLQCFQRLVYLEGVREDLEGSWGSLCEILSQNFLTETEENHEQFHASQCHARNSEHLQKTKNGDLPLS
jgi:hypothetical protein